MTKVLIEMTLTLNDDGDDTNLKIVMTTVLIEMMLSISSYWRSTLDTKVY